jgi:hypothetical protein
MESDHIHQVIEIRQSRMNLDTKIPRKAGEIYLWDYQKIKEKSVY